MFIVWLLFVQIVSESLPISSSGHVTLMERLFSLLGCGHDCTNYSWIVDFLSHGPTIAIVLFYFFSTWWQLVFLQKPKASLLFVKSSYYALLKPMLFVLCADIITFLFWMLDLAHLPFVQQHFLPIGFLITAMILYWSHTVDQKMDGSFGQARGRQEGEIETLISSVDHGIQKNFSLKKLFPCLPRLDLGSSNLKFLSSDSVSFWSLRNALILGMVQGFSLLPGISRFASTYGAGIFLGYQRSTSFALSFLIQFPLLLAGFAKAILALRGAPLQQALMYEQIAALSFWIVMVSATFISAALFYWVGRLIEQNRLWYFAYYMIIPLILSIAL